MGKTKVLAIDPVGCGCTECLTGEYVPLESATKEQALAVLRGELANNTDHEPEVDMRLRDLRVLPNGLVGGTPASAILWLGRYSWDVTQDALEGDLA